MMKIIPVDEPSPLKPKDFWYPKREDQYPAMANERRYRPIPMMKYNCIMFRERRLGFWASTAAALVRQYVIASCLHCTLTKANRCRVHLLDLRGAMMSIITNGTRLVRNIVLVFVHVEQSLHTRATGSLYMPPCLASSPQTNPRKPGYALRILLAYFPDDHSSYKVPHIGPTFTPRFGKGPTLCLRRWYQFKKTIPYKWPNLFSNIERASSTLELVETSSRVRFLIQSGQRKNSQ
ncbi:hypothetical protein BU24DRAFT_185713 [Aaosphaeria arxii CBS 175.79]|uniref:Uncharacterized protein n=1 Tax=Aaosphaeria arxii CBS 175.79 TaxID=1450172 RepID=A0A6A5XRB6_9PLEO|nr:uncharacterized protein BU24DRAFT_185713 [Aaosphaeria arxii CBS 175.79]KAF2015828.1 hypothetical protein BU24DRAFT_185713 [Aaosphaeria arxii CBS 175.79]